MLVVVIACASSAVSASDFLIAFLISSHPIPTREVKGNKEILGSAQNNSSPLFELEMKRNYSLHDDCILHRCEGAEDVSIEIAEIEYLICFSKTICMLCMTREQIPKTRYSRKNLIRYFCLQ